jgi:hypothetical protein
MKKDIPVNIARVVRGVKFDISIVIHLSGTV